MEDDFYWSAFNQGVGIGGTEENQTYTFQNGTVYSIFDTGSSGLFLSIDYFQEIIKKMFEHAGSTNFKIERGSVFSECIKPDRLPTLHFMFDERWI